ncbi:hypothetical protein ACT3TZ_02330 [Brachybacterium sp. AOP25-B2-12]|uniref:hypothetical protein n=1 Tax=Brachybacterium sp. AOP25-B2-12 TaxID=3457710 RepID=UPI00403481A0
MGGDELWDLGLSDAALIGIFALIVVVASIAVVVWLIVVPEKRAGPPEDRAMDHIVRREHDHARDITQELDDEAGRTDPGTRRRR